MANKFKIGDWVIYNNQSGIIQKITQKKASIKINGVHNLIDAPIKDIELFAD